MVVTGVEQQFSQRGHVDSGEEDGRVLGSLAVEETDVPVESAHCRQVLVVLHSFSLDSHCG